MGELWYHDQQVELEGQELHHGDVLEIRVFGSWLRGIMLFDRSGWQLLTTENVGIRLYPGLHARRVFTNG